MPPRALPGLIRHPQLKLVKVVAGLKMLARLTVLTGLSVLAGRQVVALRMLAHSDALANPDGTGTEHAAQLAGAWQVSAVA